MRLIPLHNLLYATTRTLGATAAALKVLPTASNNWAPAWLSVGDTEQILRLGWHDNADEPTPAHDPEPRSLFGIHDCATFFQDSQALTLELRIEISEPLLNAMPGQFITQQRRETPVESLGCLWLALTFERPTHWASDANYGRQSQTLAELVIGVTAQCLWGLYQSTQTHADPATGLPGATELHEQLRRSCRQNGAVDGLTLLLVRLDDYVQHTRQQGYQHTDAWLRCTAGQLEDVVRREDRIYRFGDGQFAVLAKVDGHTGADTLAKKLLAATQSVAQALEFHSTQASIGYCYHSATPTAGGSANPTTNLDPHLLCLTAEQALDRARLLGGNQAVAFRGDFEADDISLANAPGGMLTADPATDYRNSQLLWRTIGLVATHNSPQALCTAFVSLLEECLSDTQAYLQQQGLGRLESLLGTNSSAEPVANPLSQQQEAQVRNTLVQQKTTHQPASAHTKASLAIPLATGNQIYGALVLEAPEDFGVADQVFFKALASQIAGALERAALTEQERLRSNAESSALRAEISALKQQQAPTQVAQSESMRSVLDYVQRIAATDITVLIMGESGAGKEVMAHSIHQASDRAALPLVIVDCSAIAHSLIDSELFGRVKGAFTGADAASPGRIAQAAGGTLLLDEIGELPLDVQAKLLRFVQEKTITAVGDTKPQHINTRILCATNRNLQHEVAQGRFRGDLYYRLQVIQVTVPPLRKRREDLPGLVTNLLEQFNAQFSRAIQGLTEQAWHKIDQHAWPGNVRELQNAILRAVVTTDGTELRAGDIDLDHEPTSIGAAATTAATVATVATVGQTVPTTAKLQPALAPSELQELSPNAPMPEAPVLPAQTDDGDNWALLAAILRAQLLALDTQQLAEVPLGRWLADAVVLNAVEFTQLVVRSAARLLGMPETTLRRQLTKARHNAANPYQTHSGQWLASQPALNEVLRDLLTDATETKIPLAQQCQVALLQEVVHRVQGDVRLGAAIMGITPPTYRRWLVRYNIQQSQPQPKVPAQR